MICTSVLNVDLELHHLSKIPIVLNIYFNCPLILLKFPNFENAILGFESHNNSNIMIYKHFVCCMWRYSTHDGN